MGFEAWQTKSLLLLSWKDILCLESCAQEHGPTFADARCEEALFPGPGSVSWPVGLVGLWLLVHHADLYQIYVVD